MPLWLIQEDDGKVRDCDGQTSNIKRSATFSTTELATSLSLVYMMELSKREDLQVDDDSRRYS